MTIITALELTSQVRYIADGITTEFPITFERISDNHVKAWMYNEEDDEVTELARSVTDNVATITPPPAENDYVIVHRQTPKPALIDWATTPGESRNARVLAERQSRYIALEALDWSQYPIRSIVATSPPPFTWRTVVAGDSLNVGDNNHGVDLTTPGTLHIPPAVGQEREFSTLVRLPVGTSTIAVNSGTIDGEASISITATASDRIVGIILRSAGVFNTAGRLQVSFGVEDITGLGSVGADLVLADTQAEAREAMGLSNAVEYSVPTSGNATNNQLVKGGDSRFTTTASTSALGMMSAADKTKLDGIAAEANNYVHPTSDGSLHVPTTGTTSNNKVLVAGATTGSFSWQQLSYSWLAGLPTLGTAASHNVPASGDAGTAEVVLGGDSRMTNARPASDVYAWAKQSTKPTYTSMEVGAASATHQHSAADLTSGTLPNARLSAALAQIGALTPTSGGVPFYTAPGGPANLFTTSSWFRGSWASLADTTAAKTLLSLAAVATSGSASDLTSGTLPDSRLPARLRALGSTLSDANLAIESGGPFNIPAGAPNNPFVGLSASIRAESLGAGRVTQYAHAYGSDSAANTTAMWRDYNDPVWSPWVRMPQTETEQAALWAAKGHNEHSAALNYSAALRGSITQTTSQTTAVSLDRLQGRIQMASGTIPANSTVEFQFNNTYITADAMPVVGRRGTSLPGLIARVSYFTNGYAVIQLANTTASDMVGAGPALSFTILGVAAS